MEVKRRPFKNFLEEHFEDLIQCPVSRSVLFDPVVASDGFIYEASILDQCMKVSRYSPITRENLSKTFYPISLINKLIEYGEKNDLEICKNKYVMDDTFESNYEIICSAFITGKIEKIMKFKNFKLDIPDASGQFFGQMICKTKYQDTKQAYECLKHILDNTADLTVKMGSQNILHVFARHCIFPKLVGYICEILKNKYKIDPNTLIIEDDNEMTPINYLISRGDKVCFDALFDSGLNYKPYLPGLVVQSIQHSKNIDNVLLLISLLEDSNAFINDMSPLFAAIRYQKEQIIDHLLAKGVNINATNSKKLNAIHYACQFGSLNILMKLIDHCKNKDVLEQESYDGWMPIHIACYYNTVPVIEYLLGKDVLVSNPIKIFKGENRPYLPINLIELNQNISEKDLNELISNIIQIMEIQSNFY